MMASFAMAAVAIVTDQVGAPIEFAPVDTSKAVTLTLAEGVYRGVGVEQNTRMFNGNIVGPTIRVSPGDTFTVTLKNSLPAPGFSTANLHNLQVAGYHQPAHPRAAHRLRSAGRR